MKRVIKQKKLRQGKTRKFKMWSLEAIIEGED